ncbi:MAG: hypothetical protein L0Y50_06525 [Beijerinckiaceae bacterium]|nr:hypothetical protein [Beijerinckiaceae bacterium]MCI0735913.1 hypothetical protein [Beijerinckiaceae bacterium]
MAGTTMAAGIVAVGVTAAGITAGATADGVMAAGIMAGGTADGVMEAGTAGGDTTAGQDGFMALTGGTGPGAAGEATADQEAEAFLEQDLSGLDFSRCKPVRFEFETKAARLNMRLPAPLLDAVKARASARGVLTRALFAKCWNRFWQGRESPATGASLDLMIAAVAYCRIASVVTRNAADFEACKVAIVNP